MISAIILGLIEAQLIEDFEGSLKKNLWVKSSPLWGAKFPDDCAEAQSGQGLLMIRLSDEYQTTDLPIDGPRPALQFYTKLCSSILDSPTSPNVFYSLDKGSNWIPFHNGTSKRATGSTGWELVNIPMPPNTVGKNVRFQFKQAPRTEGIAIDRISFPTTKVLQDTAPSSDRDSGWPPVVQPPPGFPADSPRNTSDSRNSTPEEASNGNSTNLVAYLFIGILSVAIVAVFFMNRSKQKPASNNGSQLDRPVDPSLPQFLLTFIIAYADIVTDVLSCLRFFRLQISEYLKYLSLAFIILPLLVNIIIIVVMLGGHLSSDLEMKKWYRTASKARFVTPLIMILGSANVDIVLVLASNIGRLECFRAPIGSEDFWYKISKFGAIQTLVEDIPQIVLQLIVLIPQWKSNGGPDALGIISISVSVLSALHCLFSKLLVHLTTLSPEEKEKVNTLDKSSSPPSNPSSNPTIPSAHAPVSFHSTSPQSPTAEPPSYQSSPRPFEAQMGYMAVVTPDGRIVPQHLHAVPPSTLPPPLMYQPHQQMYSTPSYRSQNYKNQYPSQF